MATTLSVMSCDRVMGLWVRGQSMLVQRPQKARWQQVSLGTPAVLISNVML